MIGYLDCTSGVSGDKFLGAVLDAGEAEGLFGAADLAAIAARLAPEAEVRVERGSSHGIAAVGVRVSGGRDPRPRTWAGIRATLERAELPPAAAEAASAVFQALAEAEAAVHGIEPDDVHFHEIGAADTIVDVAGVCAGLAALGVESLVTSPIALGGGTVETAHGILPVPAPATMRLLDRWAVTGGPVDGELTTPTGAALAATLAAGFGPMPPLVTRLAGYGAGTRDIGMPNVCRLVVGDQALGMSAEPVALLETNLDHLSAEQLAFAAERLRELPGVADVWHTPIAMKKGRTGVMLSVLVSAGDDAAAAASLIELTGTLGVRRLDIGRYVAAREVREIASPWGPVRVKAGAGRLRPEHDDIARIAERTGRPYDEVARTLTRLAEEQRDA